MSSLKYSSPLISSLDHKHKTDLFLLVSKIYSITVLPLIAIIFFLVLPLKVLL